MSKHLSPQLKIDNNGIKWYRKVTNVGWGPISAGHLVEWYYYANLTAGNAISADFNMVREASADKYGSMPTTTDSVLDMDHRSRYAGIAIDNIPAYGQTISYPGGIPDAAAQASGSGWVQFKGPVEACACEAVIAIGEAIIPGSGDIGQVGGLGTPAASGGSAVIGWAMESKAAAAGKIWMFLALD